MGARYFCSRDIECYHQSPCNERTLACQNLKNVIKLEIIVANVLCLLLFCYVIISSFSAEIAAITVASVTAVVD